MKSWNSGDWQLGYASLGKSRTSKAAASWAILAMSSQNIDLVAAGAMTLPDVASSLDAELTGFELGLAALLKLSRGYVDVIPHLGS